jgi:ATP/ADP translocase
VEVVGGQVCVYTKATIGSQVGRVGRTVQAAVRPVIAIETHMLFLALTELVQLEARTKVGLEYLIVTRTEPCVEEVVVPVAMAP